jgi:DNA invertase Pin-like site-specific DNA recombinase
MEVANQGQSPVEVRTDQGQSDASAGKRGGFQHLVSEVAQGDVGAVLGLEVSRLARSCVDWCLLIRVCRRPEACAPLAQQLRQHIR